MKHVHIHITGIVQGVGMRPFVYREAVACGVGGWVLNAGDGVHIEANSEEKGLAAFINALSARAPAAARIERVEVLDLPAEQDARAASDTETAAATASAGTELAGGTLATEPAGAAANASAARTPRPRQFRIIASEDDTAHTTLVSPDIATCEDCLRELFDPADRRYHYPFINCTNCGPRFTIIRGLPYDRVQTSMGAFHMCPECAAEYADPLDRRFHAQPDACFDCGPHLTWRERGEARVRVGDTLEASDAIIERCAEVLTGGGIVAIKGLGGFHLACRADSESAVRELRRRKRRSNKPLAVMVRDLAAAEALCHIDAVERSVLTGGIRPIVLLKLRSSGIASCSPNDDAQSPKTAGNPRAASATPAQRSAQGAHNPWVLGSDSKTSAHVPLQLAHSVAFNLPELGVMLPYTPLQHLLLAACELRGMSALVMTSGNMSGAPIEIDDNEAWEHLVEGGIADAILGNNREILSRFDDSVVRVVGGCVQMVRRARGYAPQPITLPTMSRPAEVHLSTSNADKDRENAHADGTSGLCILACGPEQKATLALTREHSDGTSACFISQHIGDLENAETMDAWHTARARMEQLFDLQPTALACDAHPGYLSSQWAREQARETGAPLIEVQHHHAHVASVVAEAAARGEHNPNKPVIGIALDGTGAGATYNATGSLELDGTIWGGEILIANVQTFTRAAHLKPWPLPGGSASIRDPRRNALALLYSYDLLDHPGAQAILDSMTADEQSLTLHMIERGINCPLTSSMGRLLDTIAAILGICTRATYEGEPAILLEASANRALPDSWDAIHKKLQGYAKYVSIPSRARALNDPHLPYPHKRDFDPATKPQDPSELSPGVTPAQPADTLPNGFDRHVFGITLHYGRQNGPRPLLIPIRGMLSDILDGITRGVSPHELALACHVDLANSIATVAIRIALQNDINAVALSGGVFMNRLLLESIKNTLEQVGLTVFLPHDLPFNDGCIAYGQAAIARSRCENMQMLG